MFIEEHIKIIMWFFEKQPISEKFVKNDSWLKLDSLTLQKIPDILMLVSIGINIEISKVNLVDINTDNP